MKHLFSGYSEAKARDFPSNAECNGKHEKVEDTTRCGRRVCYKRDDQVCNDLDGPMCDCELCYCWNYCGGGCIKCNECPSKKRSEECYNELFPKQ